MRHDTLTRARQYLAKIPPAVSGAGGHQQTFSAAVSLVWGFGLDVSQALTIMQEYNARCSPPWSEAALAHKVNDAAKLTRHPKPRGHLLDDSTAPKHAQRTSAAGGNFYDSYTPKPRPFKSVELPPLAPPAVPVVYDPAPIQPVPLSIETKRPHNEAQRIAGELLKIHRSGFSMPDDNARAIMAQAVHIFGASVVANATPDVPASHQDKPKLIT